MTLIYKIEYGKGLRWYWDAYLINAFGRVEYIDKRPLELRGHRYKDGKGFIEGGTGFSKEQYIKEVIEACFGMDDGTIKNAYKL